MLAVCWPGAGLAASAGRVLARRPLAVRWPGAGLANARRAFARHAAYQVCARRYSKWRVRPSSVVTSGFQPRALSLLLSKRLPFQVLPVL